MAPIRRYLRITLHSVLEVRIYLDEPALADSWLLRDRNPVLPRVIEAVRPYVIPKLREENEKAKGKGSKKKKRGIKDTVATDEFEVSIFLTETLTPHTLLSKQKTFGHGKRLASNSDRLGVGSGGGPDPSETTADSDRPILIEGPDSDSEVRLDELPGVGEPVALDSEDEDQVRTGSRGHSEQDAGAKRKRDTGPERDGSGEETVGGEEGDRKKKLAVKTTYDGFTIYGRVLCLIVKRKGPRRTTGFHGAASGSDMMENWVSTQAEPDGPPYLD